MTASRPLLLRCAAFAVAILGLLAAIHVDRAAPGLDDAAIAITPLDPGDSKRYGYQVSQVAGATGLLMDRLARGAEWAATGRPFSIIIATVSLMGAAVLLKLSEKA